MGLVRRLFGVTSAPDANAFHLKYEPHADLMFAWIGQPRRAQNVEVEPGVYVRVLPDERRVIGIEILDCAARFHRSPTAINEDFAQELLREYTPLALARLA